MSSPWDSGHGFVRRSFTTGVSWLNRAMVFASLIATAGIAVDGNTWATALTIVLWGLVMQMVMYDTYTDGWIDGKVAGVTQHTATRLDRAMNQAPRQTSSTSTTLSMSEFLDWCERNNISMEQVAQLVWKENS